MAVNVLFCVLILFVTKTVCLDVEEEGTFTVLAKNVNDQWKWIQNFNLPAIPITEKSGTINISSTNNLINEELLLNKIDILTKDENGTTFLHVAAAHGKYELIQFFVFYFQSNKQLADSVYESPQSQHEDSDVRTSNKLSYYLNYRDKYLDSPFHKACFNGFENIARLFIKHGANIHLTTQAGANALHIAAYQNQLDIVKMLIVDYNISVDCRTNSGASALHYAVGQGNQETVKALLLNHKANVNIATISGGATPLHVACQKGNIDIMRLLIGRIGRADIYMANTAGLAPIDVYETAAIAKFKASIADAVNTNVTSGDENELETDKKHVNQENIEMLPFLKELQAIKIEMMELYDLTNTNASSTDMVIVDVADEL